MSTQTVNLDTYNLSLLTAKEDILNPRSSTNWALFAYDGVTNRLKLADSGAGGVAELADKFHVSKPQYGLCKVGSIESGAPRIVMIIWVGQKVDDYRRTECTSHIPAIKNFFKESHAFISAEKVEDVTEEKIKAELSKVQSSAPSQWVRRSSRSAAEKEDLVGTNYRKTNAAMEMRRINRESFWARAEREEEERKEEERRRAAEDRRRLERERVLKERKEAEERDRKMNEKLQMIEEQRRKQAEQEEELRKKEKLNWELQQREHEDDMRARLKRSESIEKAAEAAALVSQRSMNPREFFRQLSASSQSPTSPGSSRAGGRPFRRYQRSLTDTAFIFSKAEESTSPLVSPFSRASPSPFHRAMSPPASPDFRPISSPQRPKAPLSPPTSPPLRPTPPSSALPSIPQTNSQVQASVEPRSTSPAEPSAPPASPTLLASLSPDLSRNNPSQFLSENSPTHMQPSFPPQAPSDSLHNDRPTDADVSAAGLTHTELVSDVSYRVQAVLVEEDEDEEEEDVEQKLESDLQPELCPVAAEPHQAEAEVEEKEEEEKQEDKQEKMEIIKDENENVSREEQVEMVQDDEEEDDEEKEQSEESQSPAEPDEFSGKEESAVTEPIIKEISTNGFTNGDDAEEQNGIVRSLSPSDTELSTSELTGSYDIHGSAEEEEEEDIDEDGEQEISENGKEDFAEQQLCVRALYDYQAEDESEISFEPGDIIKDVETVDKAWWRGWSKDGRQGLFPANYVETI